MFFDRWFRKEKSENQQVNQEQIDSRAVLDDVKGVPNEVTFRVIGEKSTLVALSILLSYLRHYLNTGDKGDITLKIGYNKPPAMPFTFTVNDQLLDDIYPGEELEIN